MVFTGVEEYFFYKGVNQGMGRSVSYLEKTLPGLIYFVTEVTKPCLEAYWDGFMLGMAMSAKDLAALKPVKKLKNLAEVVEKAQKTIAIKKSKGEKLWHRGN